MQRGPSALAAFEGRWLITRRILDTRGPEGRFEGTAVFAPAPIGGLDYREAGWLQLGPARFAAERQYHWSEAGTGRIAVRFADGRDFHVFALAPSAAADHACDPDTYRVAYAFDDWPNWSSTWRVTGPRKDYTLHSSYRRAE